MNTPPNTLPRKPLTRETVAGLIAAYRLITTTTVPNIKSPANDKIVEELAEAQELLSRALYEYAGEFLGTWVAMTNDYQPLVAGVSALIRNAIVPNAVAPNAVAPVESSDDAPTAQRDGDKGNVIEVPFIRTNKKS